MALSDEAHVGNLNWIEKDFGRLLRKDDSRIPIIPVTSEASLRAEFHVNTRAITKAQKLFADLGALGSIVPKINEARKTSYESLCSLRKQLEERNVQLENQYRICAIDDRAQSDALEALKIRWEEQSEKIESAIENNITVDLQEGREKYADLVKSSELTGVALESLDEIAIEILDHKLKSKTEGIRMKEVKDRHRALTEEMKKLRETFAAECPLLGNLVESFLQEKHEDV